MDVTAQSGRQIQSHGFDDATEGIARFNDRFNGDDHGRAGLRIRTADLALFGLLETGRIIKITQVSANISDRDDIALDLNLELG